MPTAQNPDQDALGSHLQPVLGGGGGGGVLLFGWHVVAIAGTEEWMGGLGLKPVMNQRRRFET